MYTSSVPPATPQRQFISEFQPITKSYLETSPWHAITLLRSVGYGSFHDSNDTVWSSVGCCQAAFFCFFSLVVGWSSKQCRVVCCLRWWLSTSSSSSLSSSIVCSVRSMWALLLVTYVHAHPRAIRWMDVYCIAVACGEQWAASQFLQAMPRQDNECWPDRQNTARLGLTVLWLWLLFLLLLLLFGVCFLRFLCFFVLACAVSLVGCCWQSQCNVVFFN